jgi:pheromone shutdown protein TraB
MLPTAPNIACVGALTYTGIMKVLETGGSTERLHEVHRHVNNKADLKKKLVLFPCRARYILLGFTVFDITFHLVRTIGTFGIGC